LKKYSVILVDDHQLFREGLKLMLNLNPKIGTIYQAANGIEFLELLGKITPDVILMDIDMPLMDGVEATKRALLLNPGLKIVALSMYGEDEYYIKMIEAGARGFILKNSEIEVVEEAIEQVMAGQNYFSSAIMANLVLSLNKKKSAESRNELTERESEILYHICKGLSNQEIADTLFLSKRTVDKHRENILSKTDVKNTAGLVMYAIKHGIIQV
jgi:DNA-binding NarL/FixJ family response regulator